MLFSFLFKHESNFISLVIKARSRIKRWRIKALLYPLICPLLLLQVYMKFFALSLTGPRLFLIEKHAVHIRWLLRDSQKSSFPSPFCLLSEKGAALFINVQPIERDEGGGKSITFVKISDHDMTSKELDEKIKWNVQSSIKLDLYPYNSLLVFLLGLLQKKKLVITKYIIVLKRRNFRKSVVLQQWIGVDATVVQRQSGHRHRKARLLGCLCCFSKWMSGGRNSAEVEKYYSQ